MFVRGINLDNYVPQVDLISDKEKLKEDNITLYPTGKYYTCLILPYKCIVPIAFSKFFITFFKQCRSRSAAFIRS